ncbi:MAG: hypothetical protein L6R39_003019 [Caloplaca ligustica]|nr:MAG: hypothetical protein L6R39_003019 [Caloplaca ligustica]
MGKLSLFAAAVGAASLANAFCVDFNSADHRTGVIVGKFVGSGVTGCQTSFQKARSSESVSGAGLSSNVVIQSQANDNKQEVAFYGRNNCEVLIGFGNVQACTKVGAWASFKVITIDQADDPLTNLDPAPILSIAPNTTEKASAGDHLSTPSTVSEIGTSAGGTTSKTTTATAIKTTAETASKPTQPTQPAGTGPKTTATATADKKGSIAGWLTEASENTTDVC